MRRSFDERCPSCSKPIPNHWNHCVHCGFKLLNDPDIITKEEQKRSEAMAKGRKWCPNCKRPRQPHFSTHDEEIINFNIKFCKECGTELEENPKSPDYIKYIWWCWKCEATGIMMIPRDSTEAMIKEKALSTHKDHSPECSYTNNIKISKSIRTKYLPDWVGEKINKLLSKAKEI
jgi:hypothetical protein